VVGRVEMLLVWSFAGEGGERSDSSSWLEGCVEVSRVFEFLSSGCVTLSSAGRAAESLICGWWGLSEASDSNALDSALSWDPNS